MLAENGTHHNGRHVNGNARMLVCESDYPAVEIDVTPTTPTPRWRDQFPQFTHNLAWTDADGISHSMTLRSNSLQDIMGDLKLLKVIIRLSKQKHAYTNPVQPETQPESVVCQLHNVPMEPRVSKRTQDHYFSHRIGNDLCFGRAK